MKYLHKFSAFKQKLYFVNQLPSLQLSHCIIFCGVSTLFTFFPMSPHSIVSSIVDIVNCDVLTKRNIFLNYFESTFEHARIFERAIQMFNHVFHSPF